MFGIKRFLTGLNLIPQNSTTPSDKGDLRYNSSTDKVEMFNGTVDPLVGEATTATLTNKTLTSPTITGATITTPSITVVDSSLTIQDNGDNTKQLKFEASGITTGTTRTLTAPDANTTIVGTDTTQSLTNKTLDNTTIVTIKDDNYTLQNSSDVTKQAKFSLASNTTGTTRTYTLPDATTSLVATDVSQTLSNKTLSDALTFSQISTPSNPPSGKNKIYPKSDGFFYTLNSSGGEAIITNSLTNPMTTGGDLIYGGATGVPTRLPNGSSGQFLISGGGTTSPSWSAIPAVSITGSQIANTTIAAGNIVNNTITASQIANNTITSSQIANATITTAQIASTTITGSNIASSTITGSNLVNSTVTAAKLASSSVTTANGAIEANINLTGVAKVQGSPITTDYSGVNGVFATLAGYITGAGSYNGFSVSTVSDRAVIAFSSSFVGNPVVVATGSLTSTISIYTQSVSGCQIEDSTGPLYPLNVIIYGQIH